MLYLPGHILMAVSVASVVFINECSDRRWALVPDFTSIGTFLKYRQNLSKRNSRAAGVLLQQCGSFILIEVSKHHIIHHIAAYIVKIRQIIGLCQFDVAFLAEITDESEG